MKLNSKLLVNIVTQFITELRREKAANALLNLTDKQLKGLGLTRDTVVQKITLRDWSVLNFNEVNTIDANLIDAKKGVLLSGLPANDGNTLSVA